MPRPICTTKSWEKFQISFIVLEVPGLLGNRHPQRAERSRYCLLDYTSARPPKHAVFHHVAVWTSMRLAQHGIMCAMSLDIYTTAALDIYGDGHCVE